MKFKLTLAALIIAPIMLTACAKKKKRTTLNSKNKQLQLYHTDYSRTTSCD
jgi:outer membrane murein-binding lipoprotein Lpp